jgi:hypothetical protein
MLNGTTHMGGNATGAARLGAGCPAFLTYIGTTLPSIAGSRHAHPWMDKQVATVFATDRPTRRLLERFP